MNEFAKSYSSIGNIIQAQAEHNLTKSEIEALCTAQKALLAIEVLGISLQNNN